MLAVNMYKNGPSSFPESSKVDMTSKMAIDSDVFQESAGLMKLKCSRFSTLGSPMI